jgi:hypothetical protein
MDPTVSNYLEKDLKHSPLNVVYDLAVFNGALLCAQIT